MSRNEDLPKDSRGWLEFVKGLDIKDHKKTLIGLGAAAAFGVGVGALKLARDKHVKVTYADRRFEDKGVISVVEMGEGGKIAAGLPVDEEAYDGADSRELFIMDGEGVTYPNRAPMTPQKEGTLQRVREWVVEHLTSQADIEE